MTTMCVQKHPNCGSPAKQQH